VHAKVIAALDYLAVAPTVVRVVLDCPVVVHDDAVPPVPQDAVRLAELRERWALGSSVARLETALARNAAL
jgi:hypothetical protein